MASMAKPDQPVADVRAQEKAEIEARRQRDPRAFAGQIVQHEIVADQREQQRNGEDGQGGQVFAQHDVEIAGRNGQQQFVGALFALVGPDAHRDGRNEDQHDEREPEAELVEVGQVVAEEVGHPERGDRPEAARTGR